MNRRIFRAMSILILFTVLFSGILFFTVFSGLFGQQIRQGLESLRVTIINQEGEVLFDNIAPAASLQNHLDRPEVAAAIQNGTGESERYSDTLAQTTYYYAARLANNNILRLALTTGSVSALLSAFIPMVIICLVLAAIIAFIIANKLTASITAPINTIDLDAPILGEHYQELTPFLQKIQSQKAALADQLQEIERRRDTIKIITQHMTEGLLLLDQQGRVLLANQSIVSILNIKQGPGQDIITICRDQAFLAKARACLEGTKAQLTMPIANQIYDIFFSPVENPHIQNPDIHSPDIQSLSENSANDPISPISNTRGAVILFINITQRYAAEAQRKAFSANVSHELKTPLTTITALSEMMAAGMAKPQDIQSFAKKINQQADRLINIINDIIKLSEFDEGQAAKSFTTFNLFDMANSVINSLSESASQKNIAITLQGENPLPISANSHMIDEMLYNLIDNAIKYNKEGGRVSIILSQSPSHAIIKIKDSGIGIPKAHISHIFERFYRVDKSRSRKTGGTGLGLSIIKHIAEFHNGSVSVESQEGQYTAFTIEIQR